MILVTYTLLVLVMVTYTVITIETALASPFVNNGHRFLNNGGGDFSLPPFLEAYYHLV